MTTYTDMQETGINLWMAYIYVWLQLASSSLLRLGQSQEQEKETFKNRESVYILLDLVSTSEQ